MYLDLFGLLLVLVLVGVLIFADILDLGLAALLHLLFLLLLLAFIVGDLLLALLLNLPEQKSRRLGAGQ